MRAAGYTAVGEFHYLGHAEALAAAAAAEEASTLVLLLSAYERGGLDRMRRSFRRFFPIWSRSNPSASSPVSRLGSPPTPSAPAPRGWLEEIAGYATANGCLCMIHADEQPREIEECLAEHGYAHRASCRHGLLDGSATIIHATHASDEELDLVAAAAARICACPTTEADLGDGFLRVSAVHERAIPALSGRTRTCGSTLFEELRELEGIARRQTGRRGVLDRRRTCWRSGRCRGRMRLCSSMPGRRSPSIPGHQVACRRRSGAPDGGPDRRLLAADVVASEEGRAPWT